MKKVTLFVLPVLLALFAFTPAHAQTHFCVGLCGPPVYSTTCAGGGTPPFVGAKNVTLRGEVGNEREIVHLASQTGCTLVITNASGSVVGTDTAGFDFGAWQTSDTTCAESNLTTSEFSDKVAVSPSRTADHTNLPPGVNLAIPLASNGTTGPGVCVGFASTALNETFAVTFYYGYE